MRRMLLLALLGGALVAAPTLAQDGQWVAIDVPPSVPTTGFTDVFAIGDHIWLTSLSNEMYEVTGNGTTWTAIPTGVETSCGRGTYS